MKKEKWRVRIERIISLGYGFGLDILLFVNLFIFVGG